MKEKKPGFYSLVSFQQVFKLLFKIPFLGRYKIIIKKEKQNRLGKELIRKMLYGTNAGKIGEISGVKFINSNIKSL